RTFWQLWDLYREHPRRTGWWTNLSGGAGLVQFSPDERRTAVVRESEVTVHDAESGIVRAAFRTPQANLCFAAFNRDGTRLRLASMADGSITVWALDPGPTLRVTLPSRAKPRLDPMMALGAAIEGMTEETRHLLQRISAFSSTSFCF